jgi:hypothetical protein
LSSGLQVTNFLLLTLIYGVRAVGSALDTLRPHCNGVSAVSSGHPNDVPWRRVRFLVPGLAASPSPPDQPVEQQSATACQRHNHFAGGGKWALYLRVVGGLDKEPKVLLSGVDLEIEGPGRVGSRVHHHVQVDEGWHNDADSCVHNR